MEAMVPKGLAGSTGGKVWNAPKAVVAKSTKLKETKKKMIISIILTCTTYSYMPATVVAFWYMLVLPGNSCWPNATLSPLTQWAKFVTCSLLKNARPKPGLACMNQNKEFSLVESGTCLYKSKYSCLRVGSYILSYMTCPTGTVGLRMLSSYNKEVV
jgi:hypothetical protein